MELVKPVWHLGHLPFLCKLTDQDADFLVLSNSVVKKDFIKINRTEHIAYAVFLGYKNVTMAS